MGCFMSSNDSDNFTLATLNFSGIQDSPYQFFETQDEEQLRLNQIFSEVCSQYMKNFKDKDFKWKISKFDKQWHTRYCPLYLKQCGIKKDNKMMNQKEFQQQWHKIFDKQFPLYQNKIYFKVSKEEKQKIIKGQVQQCKIFDKCAYKTIIKYVYNIDDIKNLDVSAQPYKKYQHKKFHKAYLDSQLKFNKTLKAIQANSLDLFFIQEGNQQLVKSLSQLSDKFYLHHELSRNCTSMILIKKSKFQYVKDFKKQNQLFIDEYHKRLNRNAIQDFNWNMDTTFQAVGKTLLISSHLSSKKQKNPKQIQQMKEVLNRFRHQFPQYNFVIGADINGNLQKQFYTQSKNGEKSIVNVFPDKDNDLTVYKKRTLIQPQKHKANQLSTGVKDYLITSLEFMTKRIVTINNIFIQKGKKMPLLPNSEHPYDHYLVAGKIKIL